MKKILLIDGYNAIQRSGAFEAALDRSLESARSEFLALAESYRRRSSEFDEIVVVFDGTRNAGLSKEYKSGFVKVVFSRFGESADDAIRRILKTARGTSRLTVASDDNYVTNSARAHGADTMSCASLEALFKGRGRKSTAASAEKDLDPKMVCDINESLKKVWKIR